MGFSSADIFAVFLLVVLALSWFQHDLFLNLLAYCWLPLLNLSCFSFGRRRWCAVGARYPYNLCLSFCNLFFAVSDLVPRQSR